MIFVLKPSPHIGRSSAGATRPKLVEGILLSLDLSQAFDQMPRSDLFDGLLANGCPEPLALLLVNWLFQAQYRIKHIEASLPTYRLHVEYGRAAGEVL